MDLDDDGDGEVVGTSRILQRRKPEEKKLLCECWVKISKNNEIRANQSDDTFWWKVTHAFNKATHGINHTKNMITGKWATLNGNVKSSALFQTLEHNGKSKESEVDLFEHEKFQFLEPVNPVDLIKLFVDDPRPCPPTNGTQWNQIENDVDHRG
ncbi:hypothetical protein Tco_1543855 [Tanacetum coccineum]